MTIDYDKIRKLVKLVEKNQLSELTVEEEGLSITVKVDQPSVPVHAPVFVETPAAHYAEHAAEEEFEAVEIAETPVSTEHHFEIRSPMVGVFYRQPSPDSPPYTEVGDHVEVGQTIGLIEAMKVFSEVPTEVAGRILALPVGNAKLVQQGDLLVIIDTSDTGAVAD